ncbi:MAG: efflux RND transporter periplasmic adaptor subunit [Alphaproteobacteria bacterium]
MLKRMLIMLVTTGVVLGGIFGFQIFKANMIKKVLSARKLPPQTVSTVTASKKEWHERLEAVGNVRAINGADLSAEAPGIVSAVHFKSGSDVKQGDLLIELNSEADVARLDALKATAELAKLTYERNAGLLDRQSPAMSEAKVDADKASLKNANALVAQQKATLDFKFIRAPFPGRLGILRVDIGQYLAPGTPIVSLQQLDPIFVDFYLPQQALAKIKPGLTVTAHTDTYPERKFTGKITALDSNVDMKTRNIKVRATFPNPDKLLLPGMFATVDIDLGNPQRLITLPITSIVYNSYGNIAFLVEKSKEKDKKGKDKLVAHQVFVSTGQARGGQIAILKGVKEGDVVVSAGQIKLSNGVPLIINNSVQPSSEPNPKVTNQ